MVGEARMIQKHYGSTLRCNKHSQIPSRCSKPCVLIDKGTERDLHLSGIGYDGRQICDLYLLILFLRKELVEICDVFHIVDLCLFNIHFVFGTSMHFIHSGDKLFKPS